SRASKPATPVSSIARQLAKRREARNPAVGADAGAVQSAATNHRNAPGALGAGAKHRKGVVANHGALNPPAACELAGDAPIVDGEVRARHAEDACARDRTLVRIDSTVRAGASNRHLQGLQRAVVTEPEVSGSGAASRSHKTSRRVDESDVSLRIATVDCEDQTCRLNWQLL